MAAYEKYNNVNVWWFPLEFCQSRYGKHREYGTNSCTLISLILADKIAKEKVFNGTSKILPKRAVEIFGEAMNAGNIVYAHIFNMTEGNNRKPGLNLNIPEAMTALEGQRNLRYDLREWFYTHLTSNPQKEAYKRSVSNRMTQIFMLGIQLFRTLHASNTAKNLFAAVIADSRTTIFIFDFFPNVVTFFDSHQHGRRAGAVVGQTSTDNLLDLSQWFINMIEDVYGSRPPIYEISFLTANANTPSRAAY